MTFNFANKKMPAKLAKAMEDAMEDLIENFSTRPKPFRSLQLYGFEVQQYPPLNPGDDFVVKGFESAKVNWTRKVSWREAIGEI